MKMWHKSTMENYFAVKINEIMKLTGKRMEVGNSISCEVTLTPKDKYACSLS